MKIKNPLLQTDRLYHCIFIIRSVLNHGLRWPVSYGYSLSEDSILKSLLGMCQRKLAVSAFPNLQ